MATRGVYVAFIVGIRCIHVHSGFCVPATCWCGFAANQSTFLIQNGSESITRLGGSCQLFCEEGSVLTGLTGRTSRSMKTSCGVVQGGQEKIHFAASGGNSSSRNFGCHVALWAADYRWPNAGDKIRSKSDRHRCTQAQGRSETWVGARPRQRRRSGPRGFGHESRQDVPKVNQGLTPCTT